MRSTPGRSPVIVLAVVTTLVLGLVSSCGTDSNGPGGSRGERGASPEVKATVVAKLPDTLTGFTATADGRELLVSDRSGIVRRLTVARRGAAPRLAPEPILDLHAKISRLGERGAFDLKLANHDRTLIIDYTALDGTITVVAYPYREGRRVEPAKGRVLVALPSPYAWHHGGGMAFDRSGNLYLGVGDKEFRQLDPPGPQDPKLVLGGVLRIPEAVVAGTDRSWEPKPSDMVSRGMRNPWRVSIDRPTGDLWIGEVGLDRIEEVDRIPAAELGTTRMNFGWPYFEGTLRGTGTPPAGVDFTPPVTQHRHDPTTCGMVGGFVYRGRAVPGLRGRYVFGDLCSRKVRALVLGRDGKASSDRVIGTLPSTIVSFGADADDELWGLGADGTLVRFDAPDRRVAPDTQGADISETVPTSVPRSAKNCEGVVSTVQPLTDMDALRPTDLERTFHQVLAQLADLVPSLPSYLAHDGVVVQAALTELSDQLSHAGWRPTEPSMKATRQAMLDGTGDFAGFPESMARIVDSECG
jgi:glucose/arabinose dehydrogenase